MYRMEALLKPTLRRLKLHYTLFWLIPLAVIVLCEVDWLPVGLRAEDDEGRYTFETINILLTAFLIPIALKFFGRFLKKADTFPLGQRLSAYVRWSRLRLLMSSVVVWVSLVGYYLYLSNTGFFCMLMGFAASLFCIPGEKRLADELSLCQDEES